MITYIESMGWVAYLSIYLVVLFIGLISIGIFVDVNDPDKYMPLLFAVVFWPFSFPILTLMGVILGISLLVVLSTAHLKEKVIKKLNEANNE